MQSGSLRNRIDIIEPVIVQDPATGIDSTEWHYKYQGVPAAFRTLTAREQMAASQRQSQVTSEFEIRSGLNINPEDMIAFNGRLWDIEPPQDDPTLRVMQKIRAYDKSSLQDIEISPDSNGSS